MIHVYPINDLKLHLLEGSTCECEPRIIAEPNKEMIVVHNSFDGREGVEIVNDILSTSLITVDKSKDWDTTKDKTNE